MVTNANISLQLQMLSNEDMIEEDVQFCSFLLKFSPPGDLR